jgi:hypothetical protein
MVSSVDKQERWRRRKWLIQMIVVGTGFVASLIAVSDVVRDILGGIYDLIRRPGLFWMRVAAVYVSVLATAALVGGIWWWRHRLARGSLKSSRVPTAVTVIGTLIPPLVTAVGLIAVLAPSPEHDRDVARLFAQTARRGGGWIRVYGNNGQATYVVGDRGSGDGSDASAEITFHAFGDSHEYNSGWAIFFLRGVSFGEFKVLKFEIRGNAGGEQIGVKAKDAEGSEAALTVDERYLPGGITRSWREIKIPFTNFGRVKFDMLENVSLYSTGKMAGMAPQTISVRRFEMRRD